MEQAKIRSQFSQCKFYRAAQMQIQIGSLQERSGREESCSRTELELNQSGHQTGPCYHVSAKELKCSSVQRPPFYDYCLEHCSCNCSLLKSHNAPN